MYVSAKGEEFSRWSVQTLPSAHSIISSRGRLARYIVVVFHHIGRPRQSMMSQKERMTRERRLVSAGFSGGGSLGDVPAVVSIGGEFEEMVGASAAAVSALVRIRTDMAALDWRLEAPTTRSSLGSYSQIWGPCIKVARELLSWHLLGRSGIRLVQGRQVAQHVEIAITATVHANLFTIFARPWKCNPASIIPRNDARDQRLKKEKAFSRSRRYHGIPRT